MNQTSKRVLPNKYRVLGGRFRDLGTEFAAGLEARLAVITQAEVSACL